MNVLMISIGDMILSPEGEDIFLRHKEYADAIGSIDMIVYSPEGKRLKPKKMGNLSVYPTLSKNKSTSLTDYLRIAKSIINTKKIDVITTQDPILTGLVGFILKKLYNIPLHIQNHSSYVRNKKWILESPFPRLLYNQLINFLIPKADRLRVVNTSEKSKCIKYLHVAPEKIDVAPIPVDVEFWQRKVSNADKIATINALNIKKGIPTLTWAGRFAKEKNLKYLFKSVSIVMKHRPVNLVMVGNTRNSDWDLQSLEKIFGIKPIYTGFLTKEKLRIIYNITDVYIHSSNYEGFGMVLVEAQSCGIPVVSRKTDGAIEIVTHGMTGYIIEGSESLFAQHILHLLNNPLMAKEFGKESKKIMKIKFPKNMIFRQVIDSILKTVIIK